jgi:carboxymethylenebutenolidase
LAALREHQFHNPRYNRIKKGIQMKTETLSFDTAGGSTSAFVAIPEQPTNKAVIVIQEWWGLNDHIKDITGRYADEGFIAIAPDLYRGKLATNPKEAGQMMSDLKIDDGLDTIKNSVEAARSKFDLTHFGITGFCMGGTYALRAACELEGFSAAAPFYGDIPEDEVLRKLTTPTIFVSGTKDGWINTEKVATLEDAAERYELPIHSVKYEADHAFFNNTRPEVYDETAARDAWALVIGFFNDKL